MILPTRLALVLLAGLSGVALMGVFTPVALDAVLIGDALVITLVVADGMLAVSVRRLSVVREAATTFTVSRDTGIGYRWHNSGAWPARLQVREVRPDVLGGAQPPRAVVVPARGRVWEQSLVRAVRRGKEDGGWFAIRSAGPLRLGRRLGRIPLPWAVRVYPHLPATRLKASIAEAAKRREAGLRAQRHPGEGRQFESLREWVPGDDIRRIDWKATARRRKVIARQYEEERRQQVLLVLDAGRLMSEELDDGESRFEHAVRAAQLLALAAVHHDDNVGIMVFADEPTHYVAPQRGRRGLRRVLDVLAEAEPRLVEPDYPAAFRHLAVRNRKRALTVVFTDAVDRLASEALVSHVGSLRPRHLPLVVTLRNPALDAVAGEWPEVAPDAYRKAAAEELLHARDEALARMRQAGALVLDVDPHRASGAVVERYLELKRRGRL